MRILFLTVFVFLLSCNSKTDEILNNSDLYHEIITVPKKINKKLKTNDSIFYIFPRKDSIIILSSTQEDQYKYSYIKDKDGYFNDGGNKFILITPEKKEFNIIKDKSKLATANNLDAIHDYDNFEIDFPKGTVYILHNGTIKLVYIGNLKSFFKNKSDYQPPVPR